MSVWINPVFSLTTVRKLAKHLTYEDLIELPNFTNKSTGNDIGIFNINKPSTLKELLRNDVIQLDEIEPMLPASSDEAVLKALSGYNRIESGIEAVYTVIECIATKEILFKDAMDWDKIEQNVRSCAKIVGPSTQMHVDSWLNYFEGKWDDKEHIYWENASEGIKHAQALTNQKVTRIPAFELDNIAELPENKFLISSTFKWLLKEDLFILCGVKDRYDVALILTSDDMHRIYKTCACLGNILLYATDYNFKAKFSENPFVLTFSRIIKSIKETKGDRTNHIAKAYHQLAQKLYAQLSASPHEDQVESLREEFFKNNLNHIVEWNFFDQFQYSVRTKLEIIKIYKCLPSPDFDVVSSLGSIKQYHDFPNLAGDEIDSTAHEDFLEYKATQIRSFIRAYYNKYKRNPGIIKKTASKKEWHEKYTNNKLIPIPRADVNDIDLSNSLKFTTVGTEYYSLLEDKTLAPHNFKYLKTPHSLAKAPMTERSTLHHLLYEENYYNTKDILDELSGEVDYNHVQIAWKAESHKPESRIFYMAPLKSRLAIQETERNIRPILKFKAGNFMGLDPITKAKTMSSLCNFKQRASLEAVPVKTFGISFDLKKFSLKFPTKLRYDSAEFFDNIFGVKHYLNVLKLVKGAKIAMNKEGLAGYYINKNCDLEGFFGAQNTWIHLDVMSTALHIAAKSKHVFLPASLGVFIDDGLCKIDVPLENANYHFKETIKIITRVYRNLGFEISLSKTFCSDRFAIFLNEIYYKSIPVTPGMKAFVKISRDYQNPAASILEDMGEIFSRCQGAVVSGSPWNLVYYKYLREVNKIIYSWTKYGAELRSMSGDGLALMLYTPVALGGFGVKPLQVLVTTLGSDTIVEGIAVLKTCAMYYKVAKKYVSTIFEQVKVKPGGVGFLRDPNRVRRSDSILVENRLTTFILEYLRKSDVNKRIRSLLDAYDAKQLDDLGEQIIKTKSSSMPVLKKIWDMSPLSFIENLIGKFKRANSIINLIGKYSIGQVRKNNKSDVTKVIERFLYPLVTIY